MVGAEPPFGNRKRRSNSAERARGMRRGTVVRGQARGEETGAVIGNTLRELEARRNHKTPRQLISARHDGNRAPLRVDAALAGGGSARIRSSL